MINGDLASPFQKFCGRAYYHGKCRIESCSAPRIGTYVWYRFCRARLPHCDLSQEGNGQQTTSGVAAAVWFPYDARPAERVIPWALETYHVLIELARCPESGVSIIETRQFLRTGEIEIPEWAIPLGASVIAMDVGRIARIIQQRFLAARSVNGHHDLSRLPHGALSQGWRRNPRERPLRKTRRCRPKIRLVINCAGIGAREPCAGYRCRAASRTGRNRAENRGSFLCDRV